MLIYGVEARKRPQGTRVERGGALSVIQYAKLTERAPPLFSRLINGMAFYIFSFV